MHRRIRLCQSGGMAHFFASKIISRTIVRRVMFCLRVCHHKDFFALPANFMAVSSVVF